MKVPGIYGALTLSLFLHALIVALSFFAAREFYTQHHVTPYMVSLTDEETGHEGGGQPAVAPEAPAPVQEKQEIVKPAQKPVVKPPMTIPEKKRTYTVSPEEKIRALQAIKRLEKMAALRKIVDVGSSRSLTHSKNFSGAGPGNNESGSGGPNGGGNDYYSLVVGKIRQQWIFPDTLDRDLETIVSIKIAGDGTVTVEKMEKGSGNSLFDRSVLRAITMASPLPKPLHEMELGVRFRP